MFDIHGLQAVLYFGLLGVTAAALPKQKPSFNWRKTEHLLVAPLHLGYWNETDR
jgi:hypothetical protein